MSNNTLALRQKKARTYRNFIFIGLGLAMLLCGLYLAPALSVWPRVLFIIAAVLTVTALSILVVNEKQFTSLKSKKGYIALLFAVPTIMLIGIVAYLYVKATGLSALSQLLICVFVINTCLSFASYMAKLRMAYLDQQDHDLSSTKRGAKFAFYMTGLGVVLGVVLCVFAWATRAFDVFTALTLPNVVLSIVGTLGLIAAFASFFNRLKLRGRNPYLQTLMRCVGIGVLVGLIASEAIKHFDFSYFTEITGFVVEPGKQGAIMIGIFAILAAALCMSCLDYFVKATRGIIEYVPSLRKWLYETDAIQKMRGWLYPIEQKSKAQASPGKHLRTQWENSGATIGLCCATGVLIATYALLHTHTTLLLDLSGFERMLCAFAALTLFNAIIAPITRFFVALGGWQENKEAQKETIEAEKVFVNRKKIPNIYKPWEHQPENVTVLEYILATAQLSDSDDKQFSNFDCKNG